MSRASVASLVSLIACSDILGIEEATPRPECEGAGCGGEAGGGGEAAGGGEPSGGAGGRGGSEPSPGGAGAGGAGSPGGTAGTSGGGATGGAGAGPGGATGASGEGGEGGAGECDDSDAPRCDSYQPLRCVDGHWQAFGAECTGYCQDGECATAESCGAGASVAPCVGQTSCCDTIWVPGGSYEMGLGDEEDPDLSYARSVSSFYLDRFEVTVGRFNAFVSHFTLPSEGAGEHPRIAGTGWREAWESVEDPDHPGELAVPADEAELLTQLTSNCSDETTWSAGDQTLPVSCVNWYVAFAFCVWDGGRLPTEAEWNYAASFGDAGRPYPWSESSTDIGIDSDHAVFNDYPNPVPDLPSPVGSKPAGNGGFSRYAGRGHADLAGNVAEWVLDGWLDPPPDACDADCAEPWVDADESRGVKGGSFQNTYDLLRAGFRSSAPASNISVNFGFRCARDAATSPQHGEP